MRCEPAEARRPCSRIEHTARKGKKASGARRKPSTSKLTGERRERNSLIDDLRREMERWRQRDYERVTPTTANYCHIALIRHAARIASATASGGRRDGDLPG